MRFDASQQRLRIDADQLRVIAQKPAHENASWQTLVSPGLERFDLSRRKLQMARHIDEAQVHLLSSRGEHVAGRIDWSRVRRLSHSSRPASKAFASLESGKFLASWVP